MAGLKIKPFLPWMPTSNGGDVGKSKNWWIVFTWFGALVTTFNKNKKKWCSGHHSVIDWMTSGYSKRNSPSWLGWVREIVGLSRSNRSRLHHRTSHLGKYARNHKMSRNVDRYFCVSFFSHIPDSLAIFLGDQNKHCKERALITSTQSQTNTPCRIGVQD